MNPRPASPSAAPPPRPADPLDWAAQAGAVSDVLHEMHTRLRRRRQRRLRTAAAAAVMLAVGFVAWRFLSPDMLSPAAPVPPSAVVTLPARQLLPDGSIIELRHDARVAVAFSGTLRRVVLEQGEAHFRVAKNPERPFVVSAAGVDFRAVGTAFTVQLGERKVEMLVTEGTVAVENARPASADPGTPDPTATVPLLVQAGMRVEMATTREAAAVPVVESVTEAQLNRLLAWRAPKLELSGTPLAEAVDLINRHAGAQMGVRVVLGEPDLAGIRLTGILRADNIDTLIAVLEADHGIRAERRGDEILLRRAR